MSRHRGLMGVASLMNQDWRHLTNQLPISGQVSMVLLYVIQCSVPWAHWCTKEFNQGGADCLANSCRTMRGIEYSPLKRRGVYKCKLLSKCGITISYRNPFWGVGFPVQNGSLSKLDVWSTLTWPPFGIG